MLLVNGHHGDGPSLVARRLWPTAPVCSLIRESFATWLKIEAAPENACRLQALQQSHGSFAR